MSMERLFLLDPYNDKQLNMVSVFEQENNLKGLVDNINKIRLIDKEKYLNNKKESNEVDEVLFTEKDSKITDYCYIHGEIDRKICSITQVDIKNKSKKRKLPVLASEYALNSLGMEEVMIYVSYEDTAMQNYLIMKGFESLGDNNGNLIYIKDREEKENSQRMI